MSRGQGAGLGNAHMHDPTVGWGQNVYLGYKRPRFAIYLLWRPWAHLCPTRSTVHSGGDPAHMSLHFLSSVQCPSTASVLSFFMSPAWSFQPPDCYHCPSAWPGPALRSVSERTIEAEKQNSSCSPSPSLLFGIAQGLKKYHRTRPTRSPACMKHVCH